MKQEAATSVTCAAIEIGERHRKEVQPAKPDR
jgi:hypothetical protein